MGGRRLYKHGARRFIKRYGKRYARKAGRYIYRRGKRYLKKKPKDTLKKKPNKLFANAAKDALTHVIANINIKTNRRITANRDDKMTDIWRMGNRLSTRDTRVQRTQ